MEDGTIFVHDLRNAEDLQDLPESDQGTVAVLKCNIDPLQAMLRSRASTRSLGGGKPGVDVARFRPDGPIFAIGGWDKRVRLMDRSQAAPPALLNWHTESASALDWANNSTLEQVVTRMVKWTFGMF
jgi:WD40 repeat protein